MFIWALEVAKSALFAQQAAIYVTAHNIANVNTPEYSRQQVVLSTLGPVNLPVAYLGRGVWVEEVRRIYDRFLALQIHYQQSEKSFWETYRTKLSYLEAVLGTSEEEGIPKLLSDFFNAWQDLSLNPTGYAERTALLAISENLSEFIRYRAQQLLSVKADLSKEAEASLRDVNRILLELAELNGQLRTGRNDLFDKRDALLRELAQYLDFTVLEDRLGRVSVLVGGIALVEGLKASRLQVEDTAQGLEVFLVDSGTKFRVTSFVKGGKLGALLELRNRFWEGLKGELDAFARTLIWEVNRLHSEAEGTRRYSFIEGAYKAADPEAPLSQAGLPFEVPRGTFYINVYDQNGEAVARLVFDLDPEVQSLMDLAETLNQGGAGYLNAEVRDGRLRISAQEGFTFGFARGAEAGEVRPPSGVVSALGLNCFFFGWDASTLSVNPTLHLMPELLSQSAMPASPSDNTNALLISGLENQKVWFKGEGKALQATLREYFSAMVGSLGLESKQAMDRFETAEGLLQSLETRRQEISGVSMEEEVINLTRLQRSYEAASRVVKVVDELLETLLSLR